MAPPAASALFRESAAAAAAALRQVPPVFVGPFVEEKPAGKSAI